MQETIADFIKELAENIESVDEASELLNKSNIFPTLGYMKILADRV